MKTRFSYFFTVVVIYASSSFVCVYAAEFYFSQKSFADSQALPLIFLKTKWQTPYSSGEYSLTQNTTEFGNRFNPWSLALQHRFDLVTTYTPDMIAAINAIKNRVELPANKTYDLRMDIQHLRAWGIQGSYEIPFASTFKLRIDGALLYGYYFTSGKLKGNAQAISANDYNFHFDADYYYSEDFLFDRRVEQPKGYGYSLGFDARWQPIPAYQLGFAVADLPARIFWQNAPRTTATADSDTKQYDASGYAIYSPAISGRETNERFVQLLNPRATIENHYFIEQYELYANSRYLASHWYHTLGLALHDSRSARYGIGWMLPTNMLVFDMSLRHVNIRFALDTWRPRELRRLQLEFEFRFPI